MLVITTIYCTELDSNEEPVAKTPAEESAVNIADASRELLSVYQGQNRALPIDWER